MEQLQQSHYKASIAFTSGSIQYWQ